MNANNEPTNIDTLTLPAIGITGSDQVSINISCELMKNQRRASPINPSRNISVVGDGNGRPMIFTIGTDDEFHLLKYEDGSPTGWTVINLSKDFDGYTASRAFAITQDNAGRISIALALSKAKESNTDVFVASMLSDDYSKTDWTRFSTLCKKASRLDGKFAAEEISTGTSDDGNSSFILIAGNVDGKKVYYQIEGSDNAARKFEFPENVNDGPDSLIDMSFGYAFGQRGTFFLYRIGETKTLECTTLATADEGSLHFDYSPGNENIPEEFRQLDYNCIAAPTGSRTNPESISSDLFVGAETGVYVFRDARVGSLQKVTDRIKDVHEILVTQDADNISLWVLASPDSLYYIYGKKGRDYTWHEPVLFSKSTIHIAPIRSQVKKANELFLVNQDQSITHHWQDPKSTLWHQTTMKVKDENLILDYDSFTTQIHVEDENGKALPAKSLRISSSEWMYAEANGLIYSLDRDNPAAIETDMMGNVTIISMPTDISTPIFHVEADFFDKTLNIYPNGKVLKGINAIKNGDDLMNAKTQDGQPVLTRTYDRDTLNGVAANLTMLGDAGNRFSMGSGSEMRTFVVVEDKNVKHTGALDLSRSPDFAIGMRVQNGAWQAFDVSAANGSPHTLAAFGFLDDALSFAGDALHSIDKFFEEGITEVINGVTQLKDGVSFVIQKVKDGLTLIINFARDEVLKIALDTVGAVFKAMSWVLKLVGVVLGKILAWLGALFGWDDIWKSHKVIAAIMTSMLDYSVERVNAEIEQWRASADQFFEGVRKQIKSLVIPEEFRGRSPGGSAKSEGSGGFSLGLSSPPGNWIFYQVQHSGLLDGDDSEGSRNDPFSQFVDDVVAPTVGILTTDLRRDLNDLVRLVTDPSAPIENLVAFLSDIADTVIDTIKKLVDGFLRFIEDLLNDAKRLLEGSLDIPILSTLYEWITDLLGEKEELTAINAVALVVAIPYTIIYKGIKGSAPFDGDSALLENPRLFHELLDNPSSPAHSRSFAVAGDSRIRLESNLSLSDIPLAKLPALYSKWAGMAGSVASLSATVLGLVSTAKGTTPGKLSILQKFQLGSGVLKYACTYPLPKDGQPLAAYLLKVGGYTIGGLYTALAWAVPSPLVKAGLLAASDLIILTASLIADGVGKDEWWAWVTDSLSNFGGVIQAGGQAIAASNNPETKIEGVGVALIGGAVSGAGSVIGFIHALLADEGEVVQLVNVGG